MNWQYENEGLGKAKKEGRQKKGKRKGEKEDKKFFKTKNVRKYKKPNRPKENNEINVNSQRIILQQTASQDRENERKIKFT